jgi:hypothetical protein
VADLIQRATGSPPGTRALLQSLRARYAETGD